MSMLLADGGSTKTDWALLKNGELLRWQSAGINPTLLGREKLFAALESALQKISEERIEEVFFYGAGCENPDAQKWLKAFFKKQFASQHIEVANDLLAAAKACCGNSPGIVCILGTGSSSAFYDGQSLRDALPGLGYILGDEGSGTYIGKRLLRNFLYGHFPPELEEAFALWLSPAATQKPRKKLSEEALRTYILEQVYRKPGANRFLASLTRFISAHPHPFLSRLVQRSLDDFLHLLQRYPQSTKLPIYFVGSIAYHFQKELLEAMKRRQLQPGLILQSPMEELIGKVRDDFTIE